MRLLNSTMLASALLLATAGGDAFAQQMPAVRLRGLGERQESTSAGQKAPVKVSKRLTAGGSSVYGYVGYDSFYDQNDLVNTNMGALYNFGPSNYTIKWTDPQWINEMSLMRTGYLRYDRDADRYLLTGTVPVYYTGNPDIISVCYYTYDFESGNFMRAEHPAFEKPYFLCAALNEDDGYVYGLAEYLPSQGGGSFYGKAKLDNLSSIQQLSPLNGNNAFTSMCWNCDDGMMYGVLSDGRLMKVDMEGKTTTVAKFSEEIGPWQTGLAYSPVEQLFYWNVNFPNGRSALYTIEPVANEPTGGKYRYLYDFRNDEEFYFFVTTDRKADGNSPAVAQVASVNFPDGSTSGSVSFTAPTALVNGIEIPKEVRLRYQASLDGDEYSGGEIAPGETVEIEFIDLSEEVHNFSFTTSVNGRTSLATAREFFIGVDTPQMPENVVLTTERVSWEAVTDGVHGGWIDKAGMMYDVYVDGKLMGSTKELELDIEIPESTEIHNFCATVVAKAGGKESEPGVSNYIVAGSALSLPVFFKPTADDAVTATYFDANYDENGWVYSAPSEAWVCLHSTKGEGDDWLFLPPVNFKDASKYYVLGFESKIVNEYYDKEYMEVLVGKTRNVNDMTTVVLPRFTPAIDYTEYEGLIKVDEPGVYYVAFHYVSEEMQNGIYLRNVGIGADGKDAATPAYAQDIVATPGEKGTLEATVSFTMPLKTISGTDLNPSAELTAVVSGVSSQTVTGKPGQKLEAKVTTAQGMNTVKVQVCEGEKKGLEAPVPVWTGLDIPARVVNLQAEGTADMMGVLLKWETPVEGEHGGWVGDGPIEYDIYRYMTSLLGPTWSRVGSAGTDMEYLYKFEAGAEQDLYPFGIRPKNAAGAAEYVTMTAQIAGTPLTLPMDENFEEYAQDFTNLPWIMMNPGSAYTGTWNVTHVSEFDSSQDGYLFVAGGARGTKAQVAAPRFSTKGMEAVSVYLQLLGGEDMTGVDVLAASYDNPNATKIGEATVEKKDGYYATYIPLPSEYLGKDWVALYLDVTFGNNANLMGVRRMLVGDPAGAETVLDTMGISLTTGNGFLSVSGAEGERLDVYAADGRRVASVDRASEAETFRLAPGVYIVRGMKAIVR